MVVLEEMECISSKAIILLITCDYTVITFSSLVRKFGQKKYFFFSGRNDDTQTWSIGLNINSNNVIHNEKVSLLVASLNAKKLSLFDDLI